MITMKNIAGLVGCLMGCFVLDGALSPSHAQFPPLAQANAITPTAEHIYLHVAKPFCMPGEILWFKAYLSDPQTGRPSEQSSVAYVELLNAAGESVLQTKIALGSDLSNGGAMYIPTALGSGKYTLHAYTAWMKAQGEASFFSQDIELLNPYMSVDGTVIASSAEDGVSGRSELNRAVVSGAGITTMELKASMSNHVLQTRSAVAVDILSLLQNQPAMADMSVAVYKVDELQANPSFDIVSYPKREVTSGQHTVSDSGVTPEQRYHQVAFRLTDKLSGSALDQEYVFLSVPGPNSPLYTGLTDQDGRVVFYVKDLYGTKQLAIRLVSGEESNVELISPFYYGVQGSRLASDGSHRTLTAANVEQEPVYDPALKDLILNHSLNVQAENSFFAKERAQFEEMDLDSLPFYGANVVTYRLDDYTRFVLMEEVLREYVSQIALQRRGQDYRFRVQDVAHGTFFNQSPLILLDGVPLSGANDLIAFDPLKIEKISILPGRYYMGNLEFEGIVSFSTYDGQLRDFPLESSITMIEYQGLDLERQYFAPIHDGSDSRLARMPDTRNLLYWNPLVKSDSSGHAAITFYTSDVTGRYRVVIQGRTIDGQPGSSILEFTVED